MSLWVALSVVALGKNPPKYYDCKKVGVPKVKPYKFKKYSAKVKTHARYVLKANVKLSKVN